MERIERKSSRDTCFSKRWRGLFKKASELAILAGVELAVVVFSPGGSPFCIGHPSVDDVINRYLDPSHVPKAMVNSTEIEELASSLMEVRDSVAPVQLKESVMETMGLEELEQEMRAMKKFRAEVQARIGTGPMHDGDQPAAVAGNQFRAMLGDLHAVVPHQALGWSSGFACSKATVLVQPQTCERETRRERKYCLMWKMHNAEVMESLHVPRGVRRVLFRTLNTDRKLMWKKEFDTSYTGFLKDGAQWLVENTDIKLVGIDYLSVAAFEDLIPPHHVFLQNKLQEIILVEGLKLDDVKPAIYSLHCLPLRLRGA